MGNVLLKAFTVVYSLQERGIEVFVGSRLPQP